MSNADHFIDYAPSGLDEIANDLAYRTAAADPGHHCRGWLGTELDYFVRCPFCPDLGHPEYDDDSTQADILFALLAAPLPTLLVPRPLPVEIDPNEIPF